MRLASRRQAIMELLYDARLTETKARPGFVPLAELTDALGVLAAESA